MTRLHLSIALSLLAVVAFAGAAAAQAYLKVPQPLPGFEAKPALSVACKKAGADGGIPKSKRACLNWCVQKRPNDPRCVTWCNRNCS